MSGTTRTRRSFLLTLGGTAAALPVLAGSACSAQEATGEAVQFHEEFSDDAAEGEFRGVYGDRFDVYPTGWRDTSKRGVYRPDEVLSVRGGRLRFRLQQVDGEPASAAVVPRLPHYGQRYGRYTVRLRADPVPGWKLAFLLWPDSERWPEDGEIDFPDADLQHTIGAFLHHADPAGTVEEFGTDAFLDDWHTAVVEWSPGLVRFLLDGTVVGSSTTGVPDTSMHFVLQTETGSTAGEPGGLPTAEALVEVELVRIESHPWT
ncbi:glycoside hydrolase family 16 protein [Kineococcus sp. LSe6-4]|uniref:Glycoside hydrolase family 16 protein n=1 Tax=Kineococcus halophytocola TaxID=3234027 RepID=A0ABV4H0X3_9ACTN